MSIFGIGSDIVEIKRINKIISYSGNKFAKKILCLKELIKYKKNKNKSRFLASRFVAKEAALKAFGTGISNGLSFLQLEINNDSLGKPYLILYSKAKKYADKLNIKNIYITLTDEKSYAHAIVIFEK